MDFASYMKRFKFDPDKGLRLLHNLLDSLRDIGYELDFLNIKENYLMSIILLGILLFVLSLRLIIRRVQTKKEKKHPLVPKKQDQFYSTPRVHEANNEDEGHMSDSALSFFANIGKEKGPRFRKRDKLAFYGKKMLRTVSHVKGSLSARSAEKSQKFYRILAKKSVGVFCCQTRKSLF